MSKPIIILLALFLRSNQYLEKMTFSALPFDVEARCTLKLSRDIAFIEVVDSGATVKHFLFEVKYTVVDILGIFGGCHCFLN